MRRTCLSSYVHVPLIVWASLTVAQTVVNCVRTIHLFTLAYPAVLSGMNAATLLPYLKNATTVCHLVVSQSLSALTQCQAGGTDHFRLPASYLPSHNTFHAEDCSEIWSRATISSAAHDHQAFPCLRTLGNSSCRSFVVPWLSPVAGSPRECRMHVCYCAAYNT